MISAAIGKPVKKKNYDDLKLLKEVMHPYQFALNVDDGRFKFKFKIKHGL